MELKDNHANTGLPPHIDRALDLPSIHDAGPGDRIKLPEAVRMLGQVELDYDTAVAFIRSKFWKTHRDPVTRVVYIERRSVEGTVEAQRRFMAGGAA